MSKERKLVSFDWAIKALLRDKENFGILEGFLSELLFDDIKIVEILEGESNKESNDDKSNRLDVKVRDSKDEIILIEIQYNNERDYLQRMLYASSKAITEHMTKGMSYSEVKKVISINILYFDFGYGDDYIYKGTTSFLGLHNNTLLKLDKEQQKLYKYKTDSVSGIYPEYYLLKVGNFNDKTDDSLDEWIYFLKNESVKDDFHAKGLDEAKEVLDYLKMKDPEKFEYDKFIADLRHQVSHHESNFVLAENKGIEKGMKIGKIEGKIEGIDIGDRQRAIKSAIICKKKGMPIEEIAEITGLSIEEIEKL